VEFHTSPATGDVIVKAPINTEKRGGKLPNAPRGNANNATAEKDFIVMGKIMVQRTT
jgi:hypothetical protein